MDEAVGFKHNDAHRLTPAVSNL